MSERITERGPLLLALRDAINAAKITNGTEVALADVTQPKGAVGDAERMKLLVCGVDVTWMVDGPVRVADNKYRFFTGMTGMKKAYLERGDGTFNLNRAAHELVSLARSKSAQEEEDRITLENERLAERLELELLSDEDRIRISATRQPGVLHVALSMRVNTNEAGARKLVEQWRALIAQGLL